VFGQSSVVLDWIGSHWKLLGALSLVLTTAIVWGRKIMKLAESFWEAAEARWKAKKAKFKALKAELDLIESEKSVSSPKRQESVRASQRSLTERQRTVIVEAIKEQMSHDPPKPAWRSVRVTTFPLEDCQRFAFDIANAIAQTEISVSTHFQGMETAEDNALYQKGVRIRGHESSDPYFRPPTQVLMLEALAKAGIHATLVPSETMVELIIGTAEPDDKSGQN
jgi:hypothetical protein